MGLWGRTLHRTSNYVVDVTRDGDMASARFTLVATHVHREGDPGDHLHIGGHVDAQLIRGPVGWRFRHHRLTLVWTQGDPPGALTPMSLERGDPAASNQRAPR
jgi:hypothetical protein